MKAKTPKKKKSNKNKGKVITNKQHNNTNQKLYSSMFTCNGPDDFVRFRQNTVVGYHIYTSKRDMPHVYVYSSLNQGGELFRERLIGLTGLAFLVQAGDPAAEQYVNAMTEYQKRNDVTANTVDCVRTHQCMQHTSQDTPLASETPIEQPITEQPTVSDTEGTTVELPYLN